MFRSRIDPANVRKILVITLSNIGDVIVSFLILDILKSEFQNAKLSVVAGPKGESILRGNPQLDKVFVFDKHQPLGKTIGLVGELRRERFDLILDLRNTAIPLLVGCRYRASLFMRNSKIMHMRLRHLDRLRSVVDFKDREYPKIGLHISAEDKRIAVDMIRDTVGEGKRFIVVCPSAADHRKRWSEEGFARLAERLMEAYSV